MDITKPIAALFDFDGVVVDTESQYSIFWGEQGCKYHPEMPNFSEEVKGTTLKQIFDKYFAGMDEIQRQICIELERFEEEMNYEYIPGIKEFLSDLYAHGVKTAVVTSSDQKKMSVVHRKHPELNEMFDCILTAERFTRSKPFPDCYLLGAEVFDTVKDNCIVFEDSFNGLKSGNAAEMKVVGLATTNSRESINELSDIIIDDFKDFSYNRMMKLFE